MTKKIMKKLDILIPTYNRSAFLEKNLCSLFDVIYEYGLAARVSVSVSNNCSIDNTADMLRKYTGRENFIIYNHDYNIGLENNFLFLFEKSSSDYIMYLGDDDYLSSDYLISVLGYIDDIDDLAGVVPAFKGIDIEGRPLENGRDIGLPPCVFSKGFSSSKYFCHRAHQMSGLVIANTDVLTHYRRLGVSNLYPHVFMLTWSTLNNKIVHEPRYPILVTQPGQKGKYWSYGDDGLIDDYFNNFKFFPYSKRRELERVFLENNAWRYLGSFRESPLRFVRSVVRSKNTTFHTKCSYVRLIFSAIAKKIVNKLKLNT